MRIDPVLFAPAVALFARAWCSTLRFSREGMELWQHVKSQRQSLVAAVWHDEMFPMIYLHRNQGVVAVISQSRDGEFISQVATRFGFKLARGSSRRGGVAALVTARKEMLENQADIVVTVDGPRGPRHKVKEGVIYLAAKTGAHILPIRVFMSRSFVFRRSWDQFQLPWPGASCRVVYGKPYHVSEEQTQESLQAECVRLEGILNSMN